VISCCTNFACYDLRTEPVNDRRLELLPPRITDCESTESVTGGKSTPIVGSGTMS
jgi:hypothetical protein